MFGNDERHGDSDYIPPTGSPDGYIQLEPETYYIAMYYAVLSDSDWMMVASMTEENEVVIQWRMRYFDNSDGGPWHEPGERYSWHGMRAPQESEEVARENLERVMESMRYGYKQFLDDDDAEVQILELDCPGNEVWEKIVDEAPWYPIPEPWLLACKNQLK
jgi:hypothetical protein